MQIRKTTLSSAQILALHITAVQLIPAPGAGNVILPIQVLVQLRYGTTTYAGGADPLFYIGLVASAFTFPAFTQAVINAAVPVIAAFPQTAWAQIANQSTYFANQPISIFNPGAAYTTGDGEVDIYMAYDPWRL